MTTATKFEPVEVTIRHGLFWYFAKEPTVVSNKESGRLEEVETLVQRTASQNETVKLILESDYQRGLDHHAFWTDEDLRSSVSIQAPGAEDGGGGEDEPPDPTEVRIGELDSQDLVDWLMGVGTFDGARKPNQDETIDAVEGDPALAERVLAAEKVARGDKGPRNKVETELNKLVESATNPE